MIVCAGSSILGLSSGRTIRANSVAFCSSHCVPNEPAWMQQLNAEAHPATLVEHTLKLDIPSLKLQGKTVAVVGDVCSAAHFSVCAIQQGAAKVALVTEHELEEADLPLQVRLIMPFGSHLSGSRADDRYQLMAKVQRTE